MATIAGHKHAIGGSPFSVPYAEHIGHGDANVAANDFESFRRQERFFALLNLFLIWRIARTTNIFHESFAAGFGFRRLGPGGWLRGASGLSRLATLEDCGIVALQSGGS